jgi:hypothetical protein
VVKGRGTLSFCFCFHNFCDWSFRFLTTNQKKVIIGDFSWKMGLHDHVIHTCILTGCALLIGFTIYRRQQKTITQKEKKIVVVFSGKRKSGKDYITVIYILCFSKILLKLRPDLIFSAQ